MGQTKYTKHNIIGQSKKNMILWAFQITLNIILWASQNTPNMILWASEKNQTY